MTSAEGVRILYVIDSLTRAGAEQSLVSLAPHIIARGLRLEVAYLVERPGLLGELQRHGIETHSIASARSRAGRVRALANLIRRRRPDLVHTTLFESDIAGRIAARLVGVPSVGSLVSVPYGWEQKGDISLGRTKLCAASWIDRLTAKLSVRFHAISWHVAARMSIQLGIPAEIIDVIPRARDRAELGSRSPERRAVTRKRLGLGCQETMLFAAARHEYQKGLDTLIESMPAILQEMPYARLIVAGKEGNQTQKLHDQVRALGLERNVQLLGMRSDVPDLMVAADAFVMPSRWEGLGSVLIEAMALGAPIVAADLPPIRELAADSALFFPREDAMGLASAVVAAMSDPAGVAGRRDDALRRYEQRYTTERVAGEMQRFYARTLQVI